MRLFDSEANINRAEISEFEDKHELKLPNDYREFLLKHNGGRPELPLLDVPEWPGRSTVLHFFFGLHPGERGLEFWIHELQDRLNPVEFIPIAVDQGGNFLCLGIADEHRGQIWYWDASPDFDLSETTGTMFKVANSIGQLLSSLH